MSTSDSNTKMITFGDIKRGLRRAAWYQKRGYDLITPEGTDLAAGLAEQGKHGTCITEIVKPDFWNMPDELGFAMIGIGGKPSLEPMCFLLPLGMMGLGEENFPDTDIPTGGGIGIAMVVSIGTYHRGMRTSKEILAAFTPPTDTGTIYLHGDGEPWVTEMVEHVCRKVPTIDSPKVFKFLWAVADGTNERSKLKTMADRIDNIIESTLGVNYKDNPIAKAAEDAYFEMAAKRMRELAENDALLYERAMAGETEA